MTAAEAFGAGVETTSTTLLWILAYLLHHPEVKTPLLLKRIPGTYRTDLGCLINRVILKHWSSCLKPSRCRIEYRGSWMRTSALSGQCACRIVAGCRTWTVSLMRAWGSDQSALCWSHISPWPRAGKPTLKASIKKFWYSCYLAPPTGAVSDSLLHNCKTLLVDSSTCAALSSLFPQWVLFLLILTVTHYSATQ